jgi:hypothetical protein
MNNPYNPKFPMYAVLKNGTEAHAVVVTGVDVQRNSGSGIFNDDYTMHYFDPATHSMRHHLFSCGATSNIDLFIKQ